MALVNVGDSRTYLLRHGRLRRITVDHSYVQELVATGHITDDAARIRPRRNIVTRALGMDPTVRVDAWTLPLVRGDRFLLCSDGLVDEVRDDDIVEVVKTVSDPQAAADELVAMANRQGGRDNITVVVVDVVEGADPPDPDTELDLEPAWDEGCADSTWTVDDPDAEAAGFADLVHVGQWFRPTAVEDCNPSRRPKTDEIPARPPPRRRPRRSAGSPASSAVSACSLSLVLALVIASAWAKRRGYFVAFDPADEVVISTAARTADFSGSTRRKRRRPCSAAKQLDERFDPPGRAPAEL